MHKHHRFADGNRQAHELRAFLPRLASAKSFSLSELDSRRPCADPERASAVPSRSRDRGAGPAPPTAGSVTVSHRAKSSLAIGGAVAEAGRSDSCRAKPLARSLSL